MSNKIPERSSKGKMLVKYTAIGALLAFAPVMLFTQILMPVMSVQ